LNQLERNWGWGLALIALTVMVHATAIASMAVLTQSIRRRAETWRHIRVRHLFTVIIGLIGTVGLLLAILHGLEAALWAVAYWWLGALKSPNDALLYSVDSMTTRGASGLTLERHWLMMGALEAMDGMLLFGISTAFVFASMQTLWPVMTQRLRR
jgi:hypothetical protein